MNCLDSGRNVTKSKPPYLPYPTLPYPTLPYPTLPYPTLPYPTLPYPTLPYPTLPYPTLPYPTQLIEHLTNTTSVAPPPASPAGCRPLYLLDLLYLSFIIWTPSRCCILQFRANKSFACNLLSTPSCESQVPAKETQSLSCFGRNIRYTLIRIHVLCDCYAKILCGLNVFLAGSRGHENCYTFH